MPKTEPRPVAAAADLDALLVRAAAGDCDAFVAFYDATAAQVYGVLIDLLGDGLGAQAMLESVYLEAWERMRGRTAPPCPGREWVALIARRHAAATAA